MSGKPSGETVAKAAVSGVSAGYTYDELDCQAFVEWAVKQAGGSMRYAGSNDMARNAVTYLDTLANAQKAGRLVKGALLFINDGDDWGGSSASTRNKYSDGKGNFSHVGLYVGSNALTDRDKSGKSRKCDVVHSSSTMGRVAGSTIANGWTHVGWAKEISYEGEEEAKVTTKQVYAANGKEVNVRKSASKQSAYILKLPVGTEVELLSDLGEWSKISYAGQTGYIMSEFLADVQSTESVTSGGTLEERVEALERRVTALEGGVG